MKRKIISLISFVLVFCLILTPISTAFAANNYTDMPSEGDWSYEALKKLLIMD